MLSNIPFGPLILALLIALIATGVVASIRVFSTRDNHKQQKEAWKAYRRWRESGPVPLDGAHDEHSSTGRYTGRVIHS